MGRTLYGLYGCCPLIAAVYSPYTHNTKHPPMPITQSRLLTILEAADSYQRAFELSHEYARQLGGQVKAGAISGIEAFERLGLWLETHTMLPAYKTILLERAHYVATAARNRHERERLARRRAEAQAGLDADIARMTARAFNGPSTAVPDFSTPIDRTSAERLRQEVVKQAGELEPGDDDF